MEISQILLKWYISNHRDLPWRQTNDPYAIWLSEVILQQTRVEQGMPYWYKFMEHFPTISHLATADEREVLRLWQGLGYYSRARNLHQAAKTVHQEYGGVFPIKYEQIRSLKGVGDYTAAAISSIAFNLPYAVVDGNVYRFLARLFAIETPIDTTIGKKEFAALAQQLIDKKKPGLFNQAMMEFGAVLCKPVAPLCESCPFASRCESLQQNKVASLPIKQKKTKIRNRYFDFLIFTDEESTFLIQRTQKDIWQGLYQFPLIESDQENENILSNPEFKTKYKKVKAAHLWKASPIIKHVLSHQIIYAKFWWFKFENLDEMKVDFIKIDWRKITDFGMPQLLVHYLDKN